MLERWEVFLVTGTQPPFCELEMSFPTYLSIVLLEMLVGSTVGSLQSHRIRQVYADVIVAYYCYSIQICGSSYLPHIEFTFNFLCIDHTYNLELL